MRRPFFTEPLTAPVRYPNLAQWSGLFFHLGQAIPPANDRAHRSITGALVETLPLADWPSIDIQGGFDPKETRAQSRTFVPEVMCVVRV